VIQDFGRDIAVGAFRGYRWWRAARGGWLESPWYGRARWDATENRARCLVLQRPRRWVRRRQPVDHAEGPPILGCDCGFYALHEPPTEAPRETQQIFPWQTTPDLSGRGPLVFGVAEAWGRVLLGTHGWRAEFSRPIALFIPQDAMLPFTDEHEIAVRYKIPILRNLGWLLAEWGPDRIDLARSA
jgi:hypothetical protein